MFSKSISKVGKRFIRSYVAEQPKRVLTYPKVVLGNVSPRNAVPDNIIKPSYYFDGSVPENNPPMQIHDAEGIKKMKKACRITKQAMDFVDTLIQPGVTTDEIDREYHKFACSLGYYPASLNFSHFPKSICASVNDVCCHGIPDDRKLQDGDILKMDMVMFVDGYYGDMTRCYAVGNVDEQGKRLIQCTKEATEQAISICKAGVPYFVIGEVIDIICKKYHFQSVYDFSGHGIGKDIHQLPYIIHTHNNYPGEMVAGQTFTIEPIIVEYKNDVYVDKDDWTVRTKDQGRAAQLEHTILITDHGCEVLTA
ncbi:hypothetical protein WA158_001529 [Blastocystis sp. Blastoise]